LQGCSKKKVAYYNGTEVKCETLSKGGRATKSNFLNTGGKGEKAAVNISGKPGYVGGNRKEVILLLVSINEV
jgi:hypothetical protein